MRIENKDYNDTIFLRFIAIILVVNSHLDAYYPVEYLGTGGGIGNTLFFMLSSFGIFLSQQRRPKDFKSWYSDRIKKLYPPIWVTLILIIIPMNLYLGEFHIDDLVDFAGNFFYPPFWFFKALIIYYFIGWFILNNFSNKKLFTGIAISFTIYVVLYLFYLDLSEFNIETSPFKYFYYFIVYCLGMYMALKSKHIKYSGKRDIAIALFSLIVIYSHKYMMTKGILLNIQFIQQIFYIFLAYYLLKISRSSLIKEKLMNSILSKPIIFIGGLTLEIYIVHVSTKSLFLDLGLPFPLNIILFLCLVIILSIIINKISSHLVSLSIFQPIKVNA